MQLFALIFHYLSGNDEKIRKMGRLKRPLIVTIQITYYFYSSFSSSTFVIRLVVWPFGGLGKLLVRRSVGLCNYPKKLNHQTPKQLQLNKF